MGMEVLQSSRRALKEVLPVIDKGFVLGALTRYESYAGASRELRRVGPYNTQKCSAALLVHVPSSLLSGTKHVHRNWTQWPSLCAMGTWDYGRFSEVTSCPLLQIGGTAMRCGYNFRTHDRSCLSVHPMHFRD